jgi:hypothetical protein
MRIIFKKRIGLKHIITYQRVGMEDLWMEADDFLVLHDLSHFAIETSLGFTNAFWGLIKSGINPSVFENKTMRDQLFISDEAWYAECLANLFLIEYTQGEFSDFNSTFDASMRSVYPKIKKLELTTDELNTIRILYKKLIEEWKTMENDNKMIIEF